MGVPQDALVSASDRSAMVAYVVLLLAALSRFLPHTLHGVGLNITAVGGGLLFFGARRPRWEAVVGAGVMALTDVLLTTFVFNYPFHLRSYIVTWIWYAAVCCLGSALLRRLTTLRVVAAAVSSATGFFLLSNLVVWLQGGIYPHSLRGMLDCYTMALPFYGNDLVSTLLTTAVLFGLPVVAAQLMQALRQGPGTRPAA
jgi:hypothetical protein